jgi:tetratricopeptide (TPR) repeat protein
MRLFFAALVLFSIGGLHSSASQAAVGNQAPDPRIGRIRADLFAGRNAAAAAKELKEILAANPSSVEGHMLLGLAYRTMGTPELVGEAVAELRQAVDLDPAYAPARLFLAHIYLDLGRVARARDELEAGLAQAPKNAQFLTTLGEAERRLGNPTRARDVLRQSLAIDPSSAQAHYYMGLTLLDLGQVKEAIGELEGVVKAGEQRADVFVSLGAAYLEAGRPDDGLAALNQAARIDPARQDIRVQLAKAYRLKGQLARADAELAKAAPATNANVASPFVQERQLDFDRLQEEGLLRMQQGQVAAAVKAFQTVAEIDPKHGPTQRHLAEAYARQGQFTRANEAAALAAKLGAPVSAAVQRQIDEGSKKVKKGAGADA